MEGGCKKLVVVAFLSPFPIDSVQHSTGYWKISLCVIVQEEMVCISFERCCVNFAESRNAFMWLGCFGSFR